MIEKDVTPFVVVSERFEQRGCGLWPRVWHTARGKQGRRRLDAREEA